MYPSENVNHQISLPHTFTPIGIPLQMKTLSLNIQQLWKAILREGR